MLEKTVRMSLLYDFYGQLLTERQREFFSLYYHDDLSLGEIAADYGVSRQAVYDILKRSTQSLEAFEERLSLLERFQEQQAAMQEIDKELASLVEIMSSDPGMASLAERAQTLRSRIAKLSTVSF